MRKHFFTFLLLIILAALSHPAQARLTFGVVVDQADSEQAEQLGSLARNLSEKLQEEVTIKELGDAASLVNWMDQYAAVDLALLTDADIKTYRGRFLLVGPLDSEGRLNLVARQGVSLQATQKAAEYIKSRGFSPWRPGDDESPFGDVAEPKAQEADQPLTIDAVIEERVQPAKALARTGLVLAVIKESGGILQSEEQAAGLADYLAKQLPLDIKIKEFAQLDHFTEWFMRYRMVDLAVVPKTLADANLGRDYVAIAELVPGKGMRATPELLVGRRGDHPALQKQLGEVLLRANKAVDGQTLLTGLGLQSVKEFSELTAIEEPAPVTETVARPVPVPSTPEPREEIVETTEPIMPAKPVVPTVDPVQELPDLVHGDIPPEPAVPDLVPVVPKPVSQPAVAGLPDIAVPGALPEASPAPNAPALVAVAETTELPVAAGLLEPRPAAPQIPEVAATSVKVAEEIPVQVGKLNVKDADPVAAVKPLDFRIPAKPELQVLPDKVATPVSPQDTVDVAVPEMPIVSGPPTAMVAPSKDSALPLGVELPELDVATPVAPAKPDDVREVSVPVVTSTEPTLPADVRLPQPSGITPDEKPQLPEPVIFETVITEPPAVSVAQPQPEAPTVADSAVDQQVIEETLADVEPVAAADLSGSAADIEQPQLDIMALLGEDSVAAIVAQPEIPQELRPPGIPVVRPGRVLEQSPPIDEGLFLTSLPEEIKQKEPEQPPQLLPAEEQDSGVIYIIPFVAIMVPKEVNDRIFDQFIDALIKEGEKLDLQFVILKEGLKNVDPQWLKARKYVTGEIYAYVEEAGSTAVDLRAKAKLNYHTPRQVTPTFSYLHPVSRFLDPDVSTIEEERNKLADDIAEALITEFLNALQG